MLSVKKNPFLEGVLGGTMQNFGYDSQSYARRDIYKTLQVISRPLGFRASDLLLGLRNECFGRIEKTTTPESLVRKRASLPLLEARQGCRHQPAILGIENQHHSNRAGWSSSELGVFLLKQGFCEFQFCA